MHSPILLEETLIFLVLQRVQLIDVLVFESVLVCLALCLDQSFLDQWLRVFGLLWNDSMLAENVIPICISYFCELVLVNSS